MHNKVFKVTITAIVVVAGDDLDPVLWDGHSLVDAVKKDNNYEVDSMEMVEAGKELVKACNCPHLDYCDN